MLIISEKPRILKDRVLPTEPDSEDKLDWGKNHHDYYIYSILLTLIVNTNRSSMMKCY